MNIIIYHNPACGTSRNTLALIRNAGLTVREAIREKGTPYADLGLDNPALTDGELLDAMLANPILINRPFVVTPVGVRLCRPSEVVLDILPLPQKGAFSKEDGEVVINEQGRKVTSHE
ncbi:MAG TPA: ArsC/Spx/MgsR family protein [Candidimonas sp.]|nr:ArsC/Spx/MgsR family protein [Candidimonas sp.]